MSRVSEQKAINNPAKFNKLLPLYYAAIKKLEEQFPVEIASEYGSLVNFQTNQETPIHNWFMYKQGYSNELVKAIIRKEKPSTEKYILDPFCGVGTTNLVAQSFGYRSIGFDTNPVAYLASKVKTTYYTKHDVNRIRKKINDFSPKKKSEFKEKVRVIETSFTPRIFAKLLFVKDFCESITDNQKIQDFFKLAFLSIIEDCSMRVKDGNGIKLKKNKKPVEDVYQYFLLKCKSMLHSLSVSNYNVEAKLFNCSMYENRNFNFDNQSVGLCVYSPPYANCFDYCEVYKLELWLGGFVQTYNDFKKYRSMAMRSHVNSKFDHTINHKIDEVNTIAELISTFNIWNRNIPDMLRGYFDDTTKLLSAIKPLLAQNAKVFVVVANSGYKGILVPTDLLIALIGQNLGYQVDSILLARKIRASSQQMADLVTNYNNLMRESIIVLRKDEI